MSTHILYFIKLPVERPISDLQGKMLSVSDGPKDVPTDKHSEL